MNFEPSISTSEGIRGLSKVAVQHFQVGDMILYGKYKNGIGKIVAFGTDDKGHDVIEVEPVPKGRKQNKYIQLYRIWPAPKNLVSSSNSSVTLKDGSEMTIRQEWPNDPLSREFRDAGFLKVWFKGYVTGKEIGILEVKWVDSGKFRELFPSVDDYVRLIPQMWQGYANSTPSSLSRDYVRNLRGLDDPFVTWSHSDTQRVGVATELYKFAARWLGTKGFRLRASTGQSQEAAHLWNAFEKMGLPVVHDQDSSYLDFRTAGGDPAYKGKRKVKNRDGEESTIYEYSEKHENKRTKKKIDKVNMLQSAIPKLVKQAKQDLKSDVVKTRLAALAVLLINETYERVGNTGSVSDGHYGVTTWKRKHLTFGKGKATLKYVGKSGVDHVKTVNDPVLVRELRTQAYEKEDNDFLFTDPKEKYTLSADDVNKYLEAYEVTSKDLRGYHANMIMQEKLKERLPADDEAERKKQFLKALDATAEEVGHEAATLRSQYLAPSIEKDFMEKGKVNKEVRASYDLEDTICLFVYGALRSGKDYHYLLKGADYLGTSLLPGYIKINSKDVIVPGDGAVEGELYRIPIGDLSELDSHEGHKYVRQYVTLDDGTKAQAYIQNGSPSAPSSRIRGLSLGAVVSSGISNMGISSVLRKLASEVGTNSNVLWAVGSEGLYPTVVEEARWANSRNASTARRACIIAVGRFGDDFCMLKNRDRNYDPKVKVVHENRNGVEIAYMMDTLTGWSEGMNEFGIGIVNTALYVEADESEGASNKDKKPFKRRDGERMLHALEQNNVHDAIESIKDYDDGLPGHTIVSDGRRSYCVEMSSKPKRGPIVTYLDSPTLHVRTNHGLAIPDAGYREGDDYESSLTRYETAVKVLGDVESPDGIAPAMVSKRMEDRNHPNNMVRDTENMRTTSQMVLNLDGKELTLYLIPGKVEFVGYENKLSEDYQPKLNVRIFEYKSGETDYTEEVNEAKGMTAVKKASNEHATSIALMKFLSQTARRLGVADHIYVVGGAVRNFIIGQPIKDIDVVLDSIALGKDSEWFANQVAKDIPVRTEIVTDRYGVSKVYIKGSWVYDGEDLEDQVVEIVNARKETYGGPNGKGKGYKPDEVAPATIEEDVMRREFTFNTLLWRLLDLADGPDKAEVIDITGLGRQHLEDRLMHTPLDPDRTFTDDPTRMMRAIKFFVKYNLNIAPDVAASIKRNARKLLDLPQERVAGVLIQDIFPYPRARDALVLMQSLGLVDVIAELIQTSKGFRATIAGALAKDSDVQLLLDMADLGLPVQTPVTFLDAGQRARLREITVGMPSRDAQDFLGALKVPPIDNMALIEKYKIAPKDRGVLATTARTLLLAEPELAAQPTKLNKLVDQALEAGSRTSSEIKVAGILDRVKAVRMDWLWGYDETKDRLYVRKKALFAIEHIFYDYMESQGWPAPVKDWVLTMAIVGGAASLQWKPGSDVDVSIVVDWLKVFNKMKTWSRKEWANVYMDSQYDRLQKGDRIQGRLVAKQMVNCIWGFGPWKGKGIIDRRDLSATTMGHPINYRFVRALHASNTRFDSQPPIVENASISAYIAELPNERRREQDPKLRPTDLNWVHRIKDLPRGFELKRDVPAVYDEALGLLRYMTMPFDYLWNPKDPKDVPKALSLMFKRYNHVRHDLRTEGYTEYQKDPQSHSFVYQGETYAHPDVFPANIAIKLLEKSGADEAIKKLLFDMKDLQHDRYVASNYGKVKTEIRAVLDDPYKAVKEYLKAYSKPITYS